MINKYLLISSICLTIAGCASVPMGDPAKDAALKNFTPQAGVSGVYIYRNESLGAAVKMDVEIDGKPVGQTVAKSYVYKELPPGKHMIVSKSENDDSLEINTLPGKLYYIWQEVKMGILYARTKLHLVDDEEGKKGVNETKLIAGN
ncbi:DUF2846 domain-containing protein [Denitratisoma sp. agr-D3]